VTMDALGIAIRFGLYLDLAAAFGLAVFALLSLAGAERALALRPLLAMTSIAGAGLSILGLLTMAASMADVPLGSLDRAAVEAVLTGMAAGTAWLVRMASLVALAMSAAIVPRWPRPALFVATLASGIALATLAWNGHGVMDDGAIGWLHLGADIIHLLAAGVWIGALAGLVMLVGRNAARMDRLHLTITHRALEGFSGTGTVVVGLIVVTGLINSWLLVGVSGISSLPTSLYGQLLLTKIGLFIAMLALAAANRFRLTPALEKAMAQNDYAAAISALRTSLALEAGAAITILALVAWLGTLEPPTAAG
jgi:putative copper resistance protein D